MLDTHSAEPTIHAIETAPQRPTAHGRPYSPIAGTTRLCAAKEHIFREGDRATHVYRIEAGHVCLYRTMSDGRRQVIDFAYPGDIIGLGALAEHRMSAQTFGKTRLHVMAVSALHDQARRDARFAMRLYDTMAHELAAARELVFTVSQRTAAERVACFLVSLADRAARRGEDPREIVLPMTRADIADFLGLTIETVSRMFTRLRKDGVIALEQSILVTIVDRQALAQIAAGEGRGCERSRATTHLCHADQAA